jgi:hypothetical protein
MQINKPGNGHNQMDEQNSQVAHGISIVPNRPTMTMVGILRDFRKKLRIR